MARTNSNPDGAAGNPVKVVIRRKTLKQIVGSGGGVAPSVAKLIGDPVKEPQKGTGPSTRASARDYRDYLRT